MIDMYLLCYLPTLLTVFALSTFPILPTFPMFPSFQMLAKMVILPTVPSRLSFMPTVRTLPPFRILPTVPTWPTFLIVQTMPTLLPLLIVSSLPTLPTWLILPTVHYLLCLLCPLCPLSHSPHSTQQNILQQLREVVSSFNGSLFELLGILFQYIIFQKIPRLYYTLLSSTL